MTAWLNNFHTVFTDRCEDEKVCLNCVPVTLSQFFHMLVCYCRFLLLYNYVGSTIKKEKKKKRGKWDSDSKYLGNLIYTYSKNTAYISHILQTTFKMYPPLNDSST